MSRIRNLPVQLLLFVVLPLTLALIAVAAGGLALHQRAMRQMVGERDERATRAAALSMEEQLQRRAATVVSLARHAEHAPPAVALADSASFAGDFVALAVFGPDGAPAAVSDAAWWAAANLRATDFPPADAAGRAQFRPLMADPRGGGPLMPIVARTASSGAAVGVFDPAAIARDALGRIILPGDHTVAYLIAPDGTTLFQIGESSHSGPVSAHPGVAEALRGEIGTTFLDVGNDEHVISHTPVNPVGWALVVEEPWREVTDPMLRWTELAPFLLLPVLAMALATLWFGARQVVRPLRDLAARTTALGRGDFEAVTRPVGGIGEIRGLQGELVLMARRLRGAQQGLRDYLGALTQGQEEERRRLARELHDDTIQSLIVLNQRIQLAETAADVALTAQLGEMARLTTDTIADLRRLTRDLRPSYLDDLGLVPALELLARDMTTALGLPVTFAAGGTPCRWPPAVELAAYRVAQEALRNVGRHARAGHAAMTLDFAADRATLTVADDGIGFAADRTGELVMAGHFGLLGARERAEAVGATLDVLSSPGQGTRVVMTCHRDQSPAAVP